MEHDYQSVAFQQAFRNLANGVLDAFHLRTGMESRPICKLESC